MGLASSAVRQGILCAIICLLQAPPPGSDEGAIFALAGLSNSPEFRKALKEEHEKARRRVRAKSTGTVETSLQPVSTLANNAASTRSTDARAKLKTPPIALP